MDLIDSGVQFFSSLVLPVLAGNPTRHARQPRCGPLIGYRWAFARVAYVDSKPLSNDILVVIVQHKSGSIFANRRDQEHFYSTSKPSYSRQVSPASHRPFYFVPD